MATDRQEILQKHLDRLRAGKKALRGRLAELKRENRALERSLRETRNVLEDIPAGVVLVQEGKILLANRTAWERLGYEKEDLLGRSFVEFIYADSVKDVKAIHRKRLAGKLVPNVYEAHMINKEGERVCCEVRVGKLRYRGKRAFLVSVTDVGKRKEREKALIQSRKREALVCLASGVSRDVKEWKGNLQRSILTLHVARTETPDGETKRAEVLREISGSMVEGDRIIGELDSLSRLEKNEDPDAVLFDLKKVVRDAVAMAKADLEANDPGKSATITLKTYLRAISPVHGNPDEIKQAIAAVVRNAMDSLPPEGQIYISTEEGAGFANIYVQDSGSSISESTAEKIFDPYFTTKGTGKRGLGLSLAHAAVSRHDGEIEVMTRAGGGATFMVKLPIARKPPKARVRRRKNCVKDSRILILSEEGIVRDLLSQVFVSKGGKVRTAATDMEGLHLLKKSRFDLVVADPSTLTMDLPEVISRMKQMGSQLPVALVNAPSEEKKFGADLVVGKPLDVDRILPLISQVLASRGSAS